MAELLAPDTLVRIRAISPPGHIRTPSYLRGRKGVVERVLGPFANPEKLAYNLPAEELPLYRIRFTMAELWGDHCEMPEDTLEAEVYAHWVEHDA